MDGQEIAPPLALSASERRRQKAFLFAPEIPGHIQELVEGYIEQKTGKPRDDPKVLDRLRNAVMVQKSRYWNRRERKAIPYRKGYQVLGYLAYHFPVYMIQFEHILLQLADDGLLKDRMRILDAGTGPGVVPLAVIDFLGRLDDGRAEIHAIERSEEHLEAYAALVPPAAAAAGGRVRVMPPIRADIASLSPDTIPDGIDLLVFSNVLNELSDQSIDERADIVMALAEKVADGGIVVIVEPADLANATTLRQTALALTDRGLAMHRPCSFIWGTRCRPERCWTFEQKGNIRPTRLAERLAGESGAYRFVNVDIKYASAVLRKGGLPRQAVRVPRGAKFARFSQLGRHRDRHINAVGALMSGDLGSGAGSVYLLCDGTPAKPVYAVVPARLRGEIRSALRKVPYGDIVELHDVIVRYNREHDAYNLVVHKKTRIRRVACGDPAERG
ncbi:MAG: small ribosomal subunit Rsm22 family protein [Methanomicrobiaceae archaeon]|uniref:DUF8157 domain-containing protein n=1 Tax=hydrocarbon metagenome TaxID=938273 RepID=A0A0W8FF14_9ZZZZ|nr:small ribosomal subunit Rsm22 family protein [Methanomicrobiaceae archaeon]MDD5418966.1 small ribosomal subunit Rsm22 family protein [Methanomicrobiaceae archaeon]